MRVGFMGTPAFAAYILQKLVEAGIPLVAAYTQPPRPQGRGYKVTPSPVQLVAEEHHIPVFTPETLKSAEIQEQFHNLDLDVAIIAAYGLLLPKAILDAPKLGCLNVHPSLLPRWRGATPIQRPILEGEAETGVTLMHMDEGLDTGDILWVERIPLDPFITTPELTNILADRGAKALLNALPAYEKGALKPIPQGLEGITYAHKLTKEDGRLDWGLPAEVLERKVRALNPWPGTYFQMGEDTIKVLEAKVIPTSAAPGTLIGPTFTVACAHNALQLLRLQKLGGSAMSAEDFLRGHPLPARL